MSASRKYMHPRAVDALEACEQSAGMRVVIVQTLGTAPQSKGVHEEDGKYKDGNVWVPYTAAVDFSVNQLATRLSDGKKIRLDDTRIRWWLYNLALHGFVGWYRRPAQGFTAAHIHAIYCGCKMKPMLQRQVLDFLADRTGLKGHAIETYWTADAILDAKLRALFEAHN